MGAAAVVPAGGGRRPWHALEERGLPLLTGHVTDAGPAVRVGGTPLHPAGDGPSVRLHRLMPDVAWGEQGPGRVHVFDHGRTLLGLPRLRLTGGAAGDVIDVLAAQAADGRGVPVVPDPAAHNRIRMGLRLTRSGRDVDEFEAFAPLGYRYLVVAAPAGVEVAASIRETIYPLDERGRFGTDDADVDAVWDLCRHTQRVCLADAYTDTPYREQAQWWGDARVQSQNTFHLTPDPRPLERGIKQIAAQQLPNGLTYGHAPTVAHTCVLPDFSLIWLLTLRDHWWQTGDPRLLGEHRDAAGRVLDYFRADGRDPATGLLRHDPPVLAVPRLEPTCIRRACRRCSTSGTPTRSGRWRRSPTRPGTTAGPTSCGPSGRNRSPGCADTSGDTDAGAWRDGLHADGRPVDRHSVHCQTLAHLAGLGNDPTDRDPAVSRRARPRGPSRAATGSPTSTTPPGGWGWGGRCSTTCWRGGGRWCRSAGASRASRRPRSSTTSRSATPGPPTRCTT